MLCYKPYERRGDKNLKKENGITLISLVITVLVMLILAGIATTAGLDSIRNTKKTSMITQLEMIQEKVNTIYEKNKLNKENSTYYNSLGQDISKVNESKLTQLLGDIPKDGYRYFKVEDLEQLDLDNITQEVIINFNTRDVVSLTGISVNENTYYRLKDIPNYGGNTINYIDKNKQAPNFEVDVYTQSNSWMVAVKDIVYNSNVADGILSYKLHDNENWIIIGKETYFEIRQSRTI